MSKEYTYEEACNKLIEIADVLEQPEEGNAIMSALIGRHKNDVVNDGWEDFFAMVNDMKTHALANGQAIEIQDRPMQLRWGWRCTKTGKTWSIKISDLKKYINSLEEQKNTIELLRRTVQTQKGKETLLAIINGK